MTTTVIRNAPWLVGWDAANQRHVYLNDGDVAFTDGLIDHVGGRYTGPAEIEIDGRDRLVMPGWSISTATRPASLCARASPMKFAAPIFTIPRSMNF